MPQARKRPAAKEKDAIQQARGQLGKSGGYTEARELESRTRATRLQQIIDIESGKLLDGDRTVKAFCDLILGIKTALLAVPAGCAQQANPKNPELAKQVVSKAIKDVLFNVTEDAIERALRQMA